MKFDTNDLVYAYLTMQEADNDIAKFEYYCTDDDFLEKYDDLSKNQKKHFFELLEQAAKKRGFLISGGEYDLERMAGVLLDEYRGGKLGRITLEMPEAEA